MRVGSNSGKLEMVRNDVCCSILSTLNNEPGKVSVYGRGSGGEGVTSNALLLLLLLLLLREARAGRELTIIFGDHRSALKQNLSQAERSGTLARYKAP